MRSVMQHHETVTYIFLGSIESVMTKIFSSKTSPFFHFARIMTLEGLDIDELYDYAQDVFKKQNITFDDTLLKMLTFLQGHPDYSAQVLQALYYKTLVEEIKTIDNLVCLEVLTTVILENRAYLEELIAKTKQKKHHYEVLHSIANSYSVELSSRTLYNVHTSLEEMGLIKNISRGKYTINDIFLEVLLQQKDEGFLLEEQLLNHAIALK
jgi:GTPase SAR1 family protein